MDSVYLETTVVGNIAGRMHPDPTIAARQRVTRNWWATAAARYELFVSQVTIDECAAGDSDAASERLGVIGNLSLLDETDAAENLADLLIARLAVPESQPRDALHIAIATVHGVQFIVTRNFKHILNPHLQTKIADTCYEGGYVPPVICTPEQLVERAKMNPPDPTEEIRRIKRQLAAQFDNDLHRIAEDTRRRQREPGRRIVTRPPRVPKTTNTSNQSIHATGIGDRDST